MNTRHLLLSALLSLFSISGIANTAPVSGTITTHCGDPMPGLTVHFGSELTVITDQEGFYQIDLEIGQDYTVFASLDDEMMNGVDAEDQQIIANSMFDSTGSFSLTPYQLLAGDVNNSGSVSTFDLIGIARGLQGITGAIMEPYWFILPADFDLQVPSNPDSVCLPLVINVDSTDGIEGLDFIGVKRGDLDCSAELPFVSPPVVALSGQVYLDEEALCVPSDTLTTLNGIHLQFWDGQQHFYSTTDAQGAFSVELPPATYEVQPLIPNFLWESCPNTVLELEEGTAQDSVNMGLQVAETCPYIFASVVSESLAPGTTSTYTIYYRNEGTALANAAAAHLQFDPAQTVVSSSIPYVQNSDDVYVFSLGDLAVMEAGSFTVEVEMASNVLSGSTYCLDASFTPDEVCNPTDYSWDGSILELNAICDGDSVKFTIKNTGLGMGEPRSYVVIEDDLVMLQENIQLDAFETYKFSRAANGTTQRLQISPAPGWYSQPSPGLAVEACGTNAQNGSSTGYVVDYPNHNGAPFTIQYCREDSSQDTVNVGIVAYPNGEGEQNLVLPGLPIVYEVRFQNESDSLSQGLVITAPIPEGFYSWSFKAGASSHACNSSITPDGQLRFELEAPLEAGEQGHLSFQLRQRHGNADGEQLIMQAALHWGNGQVDTTNASQLTVMSGLLDPDFGFIVLGADTEDNEPLTMLGGALLLEGDTLQVDTTFDNQLRFEFIEVGIPYQVSPFQGGSWTNGVTVFDMVLISKHIAGVGPLSTPYQLIAADVNQSENITIMDLIAIRNAILDPEDNGVAGVPVWVFGNEAYVFPTPDNPWYGIQIDSSLWKSCLEDVYAIPYGGPPIASNDDCIGIKMGDVNGDATAFQQLPDERSAADWPLVWKPAGNGGAALVPTREILAASGFQLSFRGPEQLAWETSQGFQLEAQYADGIWRLLAYRISDTPLIKGQPILQVNSTPESLELVDSGFNRAYLSDGTLLKPVIAAYAKENRLTVAPNPAHDCLTVQGQQQSAGVVALTLFNPQGQPVQTRQWMAGEYWSGELQVGSLPAGLYWLQVETGDGVFGERVVVR